MPTRPGSQIEDWIPLQMKVIWEELNIPGLLMGSGATMADPRGLFTKMLSGADPATNNFQGREVFWIRSRLGVLRGLHFQLPPQGTSKLVSVAQGRIRDFVLDLRVGSPTERQLVEIDLTPSRGSLLIPVGCAHAYETVEDESIVVYAQDVPMEDPACYAGIRADSAGIVTLSAQPIISSRDASLPILDDFVSPFTYRQPRT
jgi:dTDP-4-dehydrorhamnose 3,5-epimerase